MMSLRNQCGQGLIEYLIVVALMSVACVFVMSALNKTVQVSYGNVIRKLQDSKQRPFQHEQIEESDLRRRDLGNFFE